MNNIQSNTDTKNNPNCHDSLGYSKPKQGTVTFAINAIQGVNVQVPNLRSRGNDANNKYLNRNTKNQASKFHDSGKNVMPTQRRKSKLEIIWRLGTLN